MDFQARDRFNWSRVTDLVGGRRKDRVTYNISDFQTVVPHFKTMSPTVMPAQFGLLIPFKHSVFELQTTGCVIGLVCVINGGGARALFVRQGWIPGVFLQKRL
jgi:hypothetical protein